MFYVLAIRNILYFVAYEKCRYVVVCSYEVEASRLVDWLNVIIDMS